MSGRLGSGGLGRGRCVTACPWSLQRLKAAVHYTVGCLCEEVAEDKDVQFSKQSIAAISDITFRQCGTAALPALPAVSSCSLLPASLQQPMAVQQGFKNNSTEIGVTGAFSCTMFFLITRNTSLTFHAQKKHLDV